MSAVADAIAGVTRDARVAEAMGLGALLEGGSLDGPWAPGDQGTSFGPWQIHLPAHPDVTRALAEDPRLAALYMLPSYTHAVAAVPDALWRSDPMSAAARAAYLAERPAVMYPPARVAAAWATLTGGGVSPVGGGVPSPGITPLFGPGDAVSGAVAGAVIDGIKAQLLGPLTPDNLARFGVAVLGVIAVGVGAYVAVN